MPPVAALDIGYSNLKIAVGPRGADPRVLVRPAGAATSQPLPTPVDTTSLLPKGWCYDAFDAPLTTPPWTEGVRWMLMKERLTVSRESVAFLVQAVHGHNNRPIQRVNARMILR